MNITPRVHWIALSTVALVAVFSFGFGLTRARAMQNRNPVHVAEADPALAATLRGMRLSASIGDWHGFAHYVDVPSLRSTLLRQFQRDLRRNGESDVVESALGGVLAGVLLERFVTDETFPQILRGAAFALGAFSDGEPTAPPIQRSAYFATPAHFVIANENAESKRSAYFVFRRFPSQEWKLVALTSEKP